MTSENSAFSETEIRLLKWLFPVFKREYEDWHKHEDAMYESLENYLALIQAENLVDKTIEYVKDNPDTTVVKLTSWLMQFLTPVEVVEDDEYEGDKNE